MSSSVLTAVSPPQAMPSNPTVADSTLEAWLSECSKSRVSVMLVHARHRCALYRDDAPAELLMADPDKRGMALLQQIAKAGRLRRIELELDVLEAATEAAPTWAARSISATSSDLVAWAKARNALFDVGRGKPLSARSVQRVWHDAGGRCMFRGCGADLGSTSLTERLAAAAYLAHIIAADKDGPRGDEILSEKLADAPENIMLMCDEHHRLIDRIAEKEYTAEILNAMRAHHVATVREMLGCLKYPATQGIALLANIGNASAFSSAVDMRQAMLNRHLKPLPEMDYPVSRAQRDDRATADAWRRVLHDHELELMALVGKFGNPHSAAARAEVLAVFPLHLVPLLVLCGRIVGQARRVEVFQYHRDRQTWDWGPDSSVKASDEFYVEHAVSNPGKTVLLSLELTAEFPMSALSPELSAGLSDGSMQHVRVRAKTPGQNVISHPLDLEQFTNVARAAINLIQDQLHARHVHLIGVAPASTLFRFGQMLQAGNHCPYTVYDRPNGQESFRPAITFDGGRVSDATSSGDGVPKTILLR